VWRGSINSQPFNERGYNNMAEIQRRAAQSVVEYMEIIDGISSTDPTGLWFRGQSNCRHRLEPGALRETTPITDGLGQPIKEGQIVRASGWAVTGPNSERMLTEFKRQARPFVERMPSNEFEWMFLAQHHGLPTRLLDWSTNALVALYFAVSGAAVTSGDGNEACQEFLEGDEFRSDGFAVFVIDPCSINKCIHDVPFPIDVANAEESWEHYIDPVNHGLNAYAPICVTAPHISPRIRAQSGVFTLHGSNIWPIDYYDNFRPLITKIFVPYTATDEIKKSLLKMGISEGFIYPGLDGIAHDIKMVEKLRHEIEKAAYFASNLDVEEAPPTVKRAKNKNRKKANNKQAGKIKKASVR
jgi:hypothetical protein